MDDLLDFFELVLELLELVHFLGVLEFSYIAVHLIPLQGVVL